MAGPLSPALGILLLFFAAIIWSVYIAFTNKALDRGRCGASKMGRFRQLQQCSRTRCSSTRWS